MPGIAVIIATHNRCHLLRGALEALARQEPPGVPVSVIVADNGSTDGTRAVFEEFASRPGDITWVYVYEARPGKSHAVNAAVACADADWLAFTDDDVRPDPGWLSAIVAAFTTSDADFVVGRILPIWPSPPPRWLTPALYGVLGVPDNGPVPKRLAAGVNERIMAIGTNMALRLEVMQRLGGFRPDLGKMRGTLRSGEDHEFHVRLLTAGCHGLYVPAARVRHLVHPNRLTRQYFRRWFHENGRNVALLEAAYARTVPMLLGVPRYLWRMAVLDVATLLLSVLTFDSPARFRAWASVLWFAGYARASWFAHLPRGTRRAGGLPPLTEERPFDARL